jgi:AAA15 family ATPase/GTPase
MLISFSVENWMSFRDKATLSMVASREKQHSERIANIPKYKMKLLPIATIYGGNASGKTNFFKALNFAKRLVVEGTQLDSRIPIETFLLSAQEKERSVHFAFEILTDETIYDFSFVVTDKAIIEEKLVEINVSSEKVLYHRQHGKPYFDISLEKDDFLHFAFRGTRDNQLFLTNSVSQKVDRFKPIYDWFKYTLILLAPDTRFAPFELFADNTDPLYSDMNELLCQLDTNIARIASEETPLENIALPEKMKTRLEEDVKDNAVIVISGRRENLIVSRKEGVLHAKKLVTYHSKDDGTEAKFELEQESDGSRRIIDLLPVFLELIAQKRKKVYVIDELDRSLHPVLSEGLLEIYLQHCTEETRSQLLLTTHNALLIDQKLLRRDEMWVTERNKKGESSLYSFSEYKDVRKDKDIRKSYLQGRLGGIPRLLLRG